MTIHMRILLASALLIVSLLLPANAWAQEDPTAPLRSLSTRGSSRSKIRKVLKILRQEPEIRKVQKWALEYYKLEPTRMHNLARNARLKGLVPNLTVGLSNSLHNAFRNTRDGLYPSLPSTPDNPDGLKELEKTTSDELGWSMSATWDLDRVIFNGEALDAKSLYSLEENLVREVTTLFYSRRRVLASLIMSPPADDEEYFYELMRLEELTATLDAFTGSKFGKASWNWEKELLK